METFAEIPPIGTILPRSDFDKLYRSVSGKLDGHDWTASVSYCCHGVYGPNQPVEIRGISLTVWADPMRSSNRILAPGTPVEHFVEHGIQASLDQCDHAGSVELTAAQAAAKGHTHWGNCWHAYECPTCGAVYGVDTSD